MRPMIRGATLLAQMRQRSADQKDWTEQVGRELVGFACHSTLRLRQKSITRGRSPGMEPRRGCGRSRRLPKWCATEGREHMFLFRMLEMENISYPCFHFIWPPLRVNLPTRNSWARLAPIRSAVPIAKLPNTSPAPRSDFG